MTESRQKAMADLEQGLRNDPVWAREWRDSIVASYVHFNGGKGRAVQAANRWMKLMFGIDFTPKSVCPYCRGEFIKLPAHIKTKHGIHPTT